MSGRIYFLVSIYDIISLRRMLSIGKRLLELGYEPIFFDLTSSLSGRLASFMNSAGMRFPCISLQPAPIIGIIRKNMPPDTIFATALDTPLSETLHRASVNDSTWLEDIFESYRVNFRYYLDAARIHVASDRPRLAVFFQEFCNPSRAFIYACREAGIPVLSLQHGEGYMEQYSALPLFASHHIAFSRYNADILARMGAPEEQIFITGFPETDNSSAVSRKQIRRDWNQQYGIGESSHVILAALRPHYIDSYAENNRLMLNNLAHHFPASGKELLVKLHPSDQAVGRGDCAMEFLAQYPFIKILGADEEIGHALVGADVLVTFFSSALSEAVEKGITIFAIEEDASEKWPPWKKFNVMNVIGIDELAERSNEICSPENAEALVSDNDNRIRFIEYFRGVNDGRAVERIVTAIESILNQHKGY